MKLFLADGAATRLLTELDAAEPTRAFGLCDVGLGSPALAALRGRVRLPVERDLHFRADLPLSAYAAAAPAGGKIIP